MKLTIDADLPVVVHAQPQLVARIISASFTTMVKTTYERKTHRNRWSEEHMSLPQFSLSLEHSGIYRPQWYNTYYDTIKYMYQ